ncbi:manganese catalase family protein [Clostridium carnis]
MKSDLRDIKHKYCVDLPYPKIEVEEKNINYANLIQLNYAGMVSEFSAIGQYIFHEMNLVNTDPNASETIRGIAMVEMHHLQILGELIIALGGEPGFWINKKCKKLYWTPKFIEYGTTLNDILKEDIKGEEDAIAQYRKTANLIQDENIVAIINRIILDEEFHIKLLNNLYKL